MISWHVGDRDGFNANIITRDVAGRVGGRVQITSDGCNPYWSATGHAFDVDSRSDFAQLVKLYADTHTPGSAGKYSPGQCTGVEVKVRWGDPDPDHISTSFIERSNLTVRMGNRRFTRLTNGHSKRVENHRHALAIQFFHYNFIRKHQTLKTTPAVMAGVADHEWTMLEFVEKLQSAEPAAGGRLTNYKPAASKCRAI